MVMMEYVLRCLWICTGDADDLEKLEALYMLAHIFWILECTN